MQAMVLPPDDQRELKPFPNDDGASGGADCTIDRPLQASGGIGHFSCKLHYNGSLASALEIVG